MIRTGRMGPKAAHRGSERSTDIRNLSLRLCQWAPISEGRMQGRIILSQLRGALIDAGREPDEGMVFAVLDEWFGTWMIEDQEDAGEIKSVAVRVEPPSQALTRAKDRANVRSPKR